VSDKKVVHLSEIVEWPLEDMPKVDVGDGCIMFTVSVSELLDNPFYEMWKSKKEKQKRYKFEDEYLGEWP